MTVLIACTFGLVGLLAMMLMAYQWRTVGRLAEVSTGLQSGRLLGVECAKRVEGSFTLEVVMELRHRVVHRAVHVPRSSKAPRILSSQRRTAG